MPEPRSASWKNWMRWASPTSSCSTATHPDAPETKQLAEGMARDYDHTVLPVSCVDLDAEALGSILRQVLYEFPVQELDFALPRWVTMLENGHWLQTQVYDAAMQLAAKVSRMKDVPSGTDAPALECDAVQRSVISGIDLANGSVRITVVAEAGNFLSR